MTFYAGLLAATICWLATRLRMAPLPTIFAAWLGPLLALPYVYPSLGFDFLWGVPTYILLIALNIVVIFLFLDFGRGSLLPMRRGFSPSRRSVHTSSSNFPISRRYRSSC